MSEFRRRLLIQNALKGSDGGDIVLPSGYTQLQYITTKPDLFYKVSTGITITEKTAIEITIDVNKTIKENTYCTAFSIEPPIRFCLYIANSFVQFQYKNNYYNASTDVYIKRKYSLSKIKFCIDDECSSVGTVHPFTYPKDINLFYDARYNNKYNTFGGYFYGCKIYESELLVRNYIPCKNPLKVVGLYDLVEGKFYPNETSEEFIAGPIA